MKKLILTIACISIVIWGILRIYNAITFDQKCESYLKIAADANSIKLAEQRLAIAVEYCEENHLTSGYTSIFYKTEDDNIEAWYSNLKSSLVDLRSTPEDADQLLISNVLMKLRETLLDNDESGTKVTIPNGISIYPDNRLYFWWIIVSIIAGILAGIAWYKEEVE